MDSQYYGRFIRPLLLVASTLALSQLTLTFSTPLSEPEVGTLDRKPNRLRILGGD